MKHLAVLCCTLLCAHPATANPLVDDVTALWEAGATDIAGYPLPRPEEARGAAMFDCAECETRFVIFIATDTLIEGYGTTDPDAVIAQNRSCEGLDTDFPCTVEEFEFDGLRAVISSITLLSTETATARYFLPDGGDFVLTVMRPADDLEGEFPVIRALEQSYLRPLLANRQGQD